MSGRQRPLILLDIDGVINANGRKSKYWKDTKIIEKLEAIYPGNERKEFRIVYSPSVIEKINSWSSVAEIKWLTTWDDRADRYLAPALGLNRFDVARENESVFKLDAVVQNCAENPERLVIWIDDDLTSFKNDNQFDERYKKGVFKRKNTVLVSPVNGLIKEHIDFVDRILRNPASAAGQVICKFDEGPHRDSACIVS